MPHIRTQLRNALHQHLATGVTSVAGVFSRFQDPAFSDAIETVDKTDLLLDVSVAATNISGGESASGGSGLQARDITIDITIVGFAADFEDRADAVAVDVEASMANSRDLAVDIQDLRLTGDELIEIGTHERGTILGLRLRYSARIRTMSGDPAESITKGA